VAGQTRYGKTAATAEISPLRIAMFRRSFALALCLVFLAPETGHAAASAYINGTLPGFGSSFLWPNPPLTVTDQDSALTLTATSNGNIAVIDTDFSNSFDIRIFMPAQTLLPGTYAGASGLGGEIISGVLPKIASLDMSGHDASGQGTGCNVDYGWIRVYEVAIDASGAVTKLAIDYAESCESGPIVTFGAARLNSTVPLTHPEPYAIAGRTVTADQGNVVNLNATDSLSLSVASDSLSYQWTQTQGPAVQLSDPTSAAPTFVAPAVPVGGATLSFHLTVSDPQNGSGSDDVAVIVHNPADPQTRILIHSVNGDPVFAEQRQTLHDANSDFRYLMNDLDWWIQAVPTQNQFNSGLTIEEGGSFGNNPAHITGPASDDRLAQQFSLPGTQFAPGLYKDGQSYDPNSAQLPFLYIGCNHQIGAIQILESDISWPTSAMPNGGVVNKLAMDVEFLCSDLPVSPPIFESIRINSAIPPNDSLIPALPAAPATTASLTVSATTTTVGEPVTFTWSSSNADYCIGINGFPLSGELPPTGNATQTFSMPNSGLGYTIQCFTSNSAAQDTKIFNITSAPGTGSPPSTPVAGSSGGGGGRFDWLSLLFLAALVGRTVAFASSMPRNSTNEVIRFQRKSPYSNGTNRSGGSMGSGAMLASARAS
jgi:hypothetical protein